jgi:hypothetical protein
LSVAAARRQLWLTGAALPLFALAYMALTFGEEIGWRGFAQTTLAPIGFWRASFAISAFWAFWHLPLIGAYALLGEASWWEAPTVAVNLTLGGAFLSVLRKLTGSVWSAVLGHAVLNTAFVFIYSAPILAGSQAQVGDRLGFAAVGWMVWIVVLVLAARRLRHRGTAAPAPQRPSGEASRWASDQAVRPAERRGARAGAGRGRLTGRPSRAPRGAGCP